MQMMSIICQRGYMSILLYIAMVECNSVSVPSNLNLPNAAGSGVADPIATGNLQLRDKKSRRLTRRELKQMDPESVGEVSKQIAEAETRHHTINDQNASYGLYDTEEPAWFRPVMVAAYKPIMESLERMTHMAQEMAARKQNYRVCTKNSAALTTAERSGVLYPLKKENPGLGIGLPQFRPHRVMPALNNVGQVIPSPPFPLTVDELNRMSLSRLDELAVLYNDDFGIVEEDTLSAAIAKFQAFICGG